MDFEINVPTTRNGKATFQLLLDTSVNVFYAKGYHNTTIKDITSEAGVAAGTFYLYFKNKFVLYKYLLIEIHHDIRRSIAQKVALVDGRYEKEREGLKTFIEYTIKNPHSYNVIWESLFIDKRLFMDYYSGFAKRYERGLNQSILDGEMHDVDTELVSYILMGVANFIGLKVLFNLGSNNDDIEALVDNVMKIIKTGIFR